MSDLTTAQKDKLMNDLRAVISDSEELLRLTANQVGEGATELRGRLQARLVDAKARLLQMQDMALAKVKEAGHATDEFVHDNPWKSVGIAAGVGLVVGLLIGRR